jgi:hypothetical protein
MTAIIYFGEMLVGSIFAIALLVISPLKIGSAAAVFAVGLVSWTLVEYAVHRLILHDLAPRNMGCIMPTLIRRSSKFFGKYGFVSRWSIL